jgi:hypothetical protein
MAVLFILNADAHVNIISLTAGVISRASYNQTLHLYHVLSHLSQPFAL